MTERSPDPADDAAQRVTQFLAALQAGKADAAWDALLADSPLRAQAGGIDESKRQAEAHVTAMGPVIGFEPLGSREVAPSLVVSRYLVKHEREGMTWAFAFYRPRGSWVLTGVRWFPSATYLAP
jgi:hypothetical protein